MSNGLHMSVQEYEALCRRMKVKPFACNSITLDLSEKEKKPKMSKTEMEYERIYLTGIPHKFEGLTIRMANGHRYTPDFYVSPGNNVIELHEVKGSYKLQSYGRAKMAFDQAKIEFPEFKFVWATKTKDGWVIR